MKLDDSYLKQFIKDNELAEIWQQVELAHRMVQGGTGAGGEYLGWVNLPVDYDKDELQRIKKTAAKIQQDSDVLIVVGIGGSYLGARAVIEALKSQSYNLLPKDTPSIYFAGNSISATELDNVMRLCEGKDVSLNIVSKSGTTTEPAIAFRVLRGMLEQKYGKAGAAQRIYATTDRAEGALKKLADANGYETFVVPDDIGGRYSVLTAVGLLSIAAAGIDIDTLMAGAAKARLDMQKADGAASYYAAYRNILYRKGYGIEMLVNYEPSCQQLSEWWRQLFGESEGKDSKGMFPTSAVFSTDLHSIGQYLQDGRRELVETVIKIAKPQTDIKIPLGDDSDGLGFVAGKQMSLVNSRALAGATLAHADGGVPSIVLEVSALDEANLGYLLYFFEMACAISGYLVGINPFNQPGVEAYKTNMFALLGKPGYEAERKELERRINR